MSRSAVLGVDEWRPSNSLKIGNFVQEANPSILKFTNSHIHSDFSSSPPQKKVRERVFSQNNSIESGLSCFTMKENTATNQRIQRLKFMESNDKGKIQERLVLKQNCTDMIKKTKKEIK